MKAFDTLKRQGIDGLLTWSLQYLQQCKKLLILLWDALSMADYKSKQILYLISYRRYILVLEPTLLLYWLLKSYHRQQVKEKKQFFNNSKFKRDMGGVNFTQTFFIFQDKHLFMLSLHQVLTLLNILDADLSQHFNNPSGANLIYWEWKVCIR